MHMHLNQVVIQEPGPASTAGIPNPCSSLSSPPQGPETDVQHAQAQAQAQEQKTMQGNETGSEPIRGPGQGK